ncbi:MAG: Mov34/MPN/PAD-1 family protein [Oceanococcus sp.]
MPQSEIALSRTLATRLLKHAQDSPQQRVCGLLLGNEQTAKRIAPLPNRSLTPASAHAVDAQDFALAVDQALRDGLQPMAIYHSHPDSPPLPSDADRAASPDPTLPLLVISLNIKGVLEMRAFVPQAEQLTETPVTIFF